MFKYRPTSNGYIGFTSYITFNLILNIGRKLPFVGNWFFVWSHVSNFLITSILLAAFAYIWILMGKSFKIVVAMGVLAILLNFVTELFVTFTNTPDVVDALYGTVGVLITVFLADLFKKKGILPN